MTKKEKLFSKLAEELSEFSFYLYESRAISEKIPSKRRDNFFEIIEE
jgi:hypothetical protein